MWKMGLEILPISATPRVVLKVSSLSWKLVRNVYLNYWIRSWGGRTQESLFYSPGDFLVPYIPGQVTPFRVNKSWIQTMGWNGHCSTYWLLWVNKNSSELQKTDVCGAGGMGGMGGRGGLWKRASWALGWLCSMRIPPHPCSCILSFAFSVLVCWCLIKTVQFAGQ